MNQTDPINETSHFANLLKQTALLKGKIDALASASGERFNIFTILNRETDEVQTHSAILADLLNPGGLHGQGAVFARLFFSRLEIAVDGDLRGGRVGVEVDAGEHGRIDIMFEMGDFCVVIENKIYAPDQPNQLERYHEYASTRHVEDRVRLLYLTLHGSEPNNDSLGSLPLQKVKCISYESDIIGWLDACIKEVAIIPQIRELLVQYQNLLRKLTGRHDGVLTMVLENILKEKQGDTYNFELVSPLVDALNGMRIEMEWQFWESLRERLTGRKESRAWCLERLAIDGALEVTKDVIESAHIKGRNREWEYGWTFRVRPRHDLFFKESSEVVLRIEHEGGASWSWVLFGFLLVEPPEGIPTRVTHDKLRDDEFGRTLIDMARNSNLGLKTSDWFLAWRYPRRDVSLLAEALVKNGLMRRLIENPGAAVEEFATEVERVVETLVGPSFPTRSPAE